MKILNEKWSICSEIKNARALFNPNKTQVRNFERKNTNPDTRIKFYYTFRQLKLLHICMNDWFFQLNNKNVNTLINTPSQLH